MCTGRSSHHTSAAHWNKRSQKHKHIYSWEILQNPYFILSAFEYKHNMHADVRHKAV